MSWRASSSATWRSMEQPASTATAELPLLLFVGRLRYYKGLDYLIRALPEIPSAAPGGRRRADGG